MLLNRRLIIVSFGFMIALAILAGGASILNKWSSQPANSSQSAGNSQGSLADDPWAYLPDTGLVQLTSPVSSTSYYVTNISTIGSLGTPLGTYDKNTPGKQDHLVILDYGTPDWVPQGKGYIYGVKLVNEGINGFHDTSSVISSAVSFARNYYNAVHNWDSQSHLRMVIGVNNCCWYETGLYNRFAGHGVAWADVVNSIQDQLEYFHYDTQVDVRAGMDIQQEKPAHGGDPYATYLWLNAYRDNISCNPTTDMDTTEGCFYNFGTMNPSFYTGACHTKAPPDPTVSSYNWNYCDVWYVSWGVTKNNLRFARPLPEIYHGHSGSSTWGTDATAWENLSAFSDDQKSAGPMFFVGSLTQRARCPDACAGNNYPWEGFQLLSGALASNTTTRQAMRWSTDINYQP